MSVADLPVVEVLPALKAALQSHDAVVLEAPPGAGKSTVVPLALLSEPWLQNRKILMLEPRRLAARAVAERMARSLNEKVGETVGYRMRLDTKVGPSTRIEVVTEGVLVRLLQDDPALEGAGLVIFDEFHERNLQSDLGLALLRDACATLETDIRVLVMSATLDTQSLRTYLQDAPCITAAGRQYPVEVRHVGEGLPLMPDEGLERRIASVIHRALGETEGDLLIFLPGAAEIRRLAALLGEMPSQVCVLPLYGELSATEQDAALTPAPPGTRHVVLATNIAETSLTLPGVRVVIDSGLVRRSKFDPATGMSRLDTVRISRASADQRAGRAGRVAPGICYRLWSAGVERSLAAHTPAEISDADLAPLVLELARWGRADLAQIAWLEPPSQAMFEAAKQLLIQLGALDRHAQLTSLGRTCARWPVHPRLGRLLWESKERGCVQLGARLAALLSERDPLRGPTRTRGLAAEEDADLLTRLRILCQHRFDSLPNAGTWRRIEQQARQLQRLLGASRAPEMGDMTSPSAVLLATAFPDRIAQARGEMRGRYLLANGRGAILPMPDVLANADYLIAIELDDQDREARIRLATAVSLAELESALGDSLKTVTQIHWSPQEESIVAREQRLLGSLTLSTRAVPVDESNRVRLVVDAVRSLGLDVLPWTSEARQFCARIELLRRLQASDWPDFSGQTLIDELHDWLSPWLDGVSRRSHFAKIPLMQALKFRLGAPRETTLNRQMPESLQLPTGSRVAIDYLDELAPVASMRMQEVFGMSETPRIGNGALPVTFKLLSPAGRPLQITRDLASFWCNAYSDVRKDMRGRYPKHYWPENPLQAEPTRRTKPRS